MLNLRFRSTLLLTTSSQVSRLLISETASMISQRSSKHQSHNTLWPSLLTSEVKRMDKNMLPSNSSSSTCSLFRSQTDQLSLSILELHHQTFPLRLELKSISNLRKTHHKQTRITLSILSEQKYIPATRETLLYIFSMYICKLENSISMKWQTSSDPKS